MNHQQRQVGLAALALIAASAASAAWAQSTNDRAAVKEPKPAATAAGRTVAAGATTTAANTPARGTTAAATKSEKPAMSEARSSKFSTSEYEGCHGSKGKVMAEADL